MKTIAIVGSGVMGTALSWPLTDNGHEVRLVGTHLDHDIIQECKEAGTHPKLKRRIPEAVKPYFIEEIEAALHGVEIIVSGVNSLGVHWIGKILAPFIHKGQRIIAVTKGLEASPDGALVILPEVLRGELPAEAASEVPILAIGGPCIAGELAGRRPSCVMFGGPNLRIAEEIAHIFRTSYYHVWPTSDLLSLEVCAALKNAYTIPVGMAAGLLESHTAKDEAGAAMHNLAAALFAQASIEISQFCRLLGGSPEMAMALPGVGDLYVTATGGRSYRLGKLLGAGKSITEARAELAGETLEAAELVVEMSRALPVLEQKAKIKPQDFPLMRTLIDVIAYLQPVRFDLDRFFSDQRV